MKTNRLQDGFTNPMPIPAAKTAAPITFLPAVLAYHFRGERYQRDEHEEEDVHPEGDAVHSPHEMELGVWPIQPVGE